jgi:hypothetical protein
MSRDLVYVQGGNVPSRLWCFSGCIHIWLTQLQLDAADNTAVNRLAVVIGAMIAKAALLFYYLAAMKKALRHANFGS